MGVYVDQLLPCIPNSRWRWTRSCHLLADSVSELHKFAELLGMKRSWFQPEAVLPHYDLTGSMRAKAVRLGAKELYREDLVKRLVEARHASEDVTQAAQAP